MAETIRVDAEQLVGVSADLSRTHDALTGELELLRRRLAPLQQSWTGDASAGYHVAMATWSTHLVEMSRVLARVNQAVWASRETYTTTEAEVAAAWR